MKTMIPVFVLPALLSLGTFSVAVQPSLARSVQPAPMLQSSVPQVAQANSSQTQAQPVASMAGDFISLLSGGEFSEALQWYDSVVSGSVSSDSIRTTWQDIEAANGSLQRQVSSQTIDLDGQGAYAVIVTCEFEQGLRDVMINVSNDQIVGFSMIEG